MKCLISESELQMIWSQGLFRQTDLRTEDSRRLVIEFPGIPSRLGGPDFRNARILLDGQRLVGDVELHLSSSGWIAHQHRSNLEYANVLLHVALWRDSRDRDVRGVTGEAIPELVLEPYLEHSVAELGRMLESRYPKAAASPDLEAIARLLDAAGDERLREKIAHIERLLRSLPADEVLYRELMAALGYAANKAQFEELAALLPFEKLRALTDPEPALLSAAGFLDAPGPAAPRMDRTLWRRRGVRPSNYPERRIRAAARLFSRARSGLCRLFRSRLLEFASDPPECIARRICSDLACWSGIGRARALEVTFNVLVPFFMATAGAEGAYELAGLLHRVYAASPPPPDNLATRTLKRLIFGDSPRADACVCTARRHMGLVQWHSRMFA